VAHWREILDYIEEHLHGPSRLFGVAAVPTATHWADEASLNPFEVISGADDFGPDADDEAQVLGTEDTPAITGNIQYDAGRVQIVATSSTTPWVLRLIWGTGTMGDAETAGQYSDVPFMKESPAGWSSLVEVRMPRSKCGIDKLWARGKNASNNATLDFLISQHEYD